jgi:hypothetical protein
MNDSFTSSDVMNDSFMTFPHARRTLPEAAGLSRRVG